MIMQKNIYIFTVVLFALCAGCNKKTSSKKNETLTVTKCLLSEFPQSHRMLLGEFQAQLKPLMSIPVKASSDGTIFFHIFKPRQILKKDTLWAEINPEQLTSEEQELKLNIRDDQLKLREKLLTSEREMRRVEYMLNDPALRELPFADRIPVSTNLLEQLQGEHLLLKQQLDSCGKVKRLAFDQKMLRSRLKMPFDGELLIYLPISPDRKEFRIGANVPVGMMRDCSSLFLHIIIRDPQLVSIPPETLFVKFKRDSGAIFTGHFHDTQMAEVQNQDVLIYRFSFDKKNKAELLALIGANLTCELWVESSQKFHIVSKLKIAQMLKGNGSFMGWRSAIKQLWSDATLLYSGRTKLGIKKGSFK